MKPDFDRKIIRAILGILILYGKENPYMAGYVITMRSIEDIKNCIEKGIYSTEIRHKPSENIWRKQHEGTFADYLSMKAKDHIYFFSDRFLYGIGELVNIGGDCKFLCYQHADDPLVPKDRSEYKKCRPLIDSFSESNRCMCLFRPTPQFFLKGVDMDAVLNSNPSAFRMLRALWKVSFIKVDDEEDRALIDVILKHNEMYIDDDKECFPYDDSLHNHLKQIDLSPYQFTYHNLAKNANIEGETWLKHEMAIEASLCDILSHNNIGSFGHWDYVSHQVIASPFKPIDYMDKMDIFGYRLIPGFPTISKYLIIEIKKESADIDTIGQLMKYVDFVTNEYAHGDYSMVEAFIVAYDFDEDTRQACKDKAVRNYISGYRPVTAEEWHAIHLVKYRYKDNGFLFDELK